jgi:hypothetical protein
MRQGRHCTDRGRTNHLEKFAMDRLTVLRSKIAGDIDLTDEESKEFSELAAPLIGPEIIRAIDDEVRRYGFLLTDTERG